MSETKIREISLYYAALLSAIFGNLVANGFWEFYSSLRIYLFYGAIIAILLFGITSIIVIKKLSKE